jgi:tripartite-type tricarboxylate transporter receptor subunit TctC
MPASLRDRIAADVRAAAEDEALNQNLAVLGQALRTGTPVDFVTMIDAQRAQIAAIAQAIGFQKQ